MACSHKFIGTRHCVKCGWSPYSNNPIAVAHGKRGPAGSGAHGNRTKRESELPRKRKHKGRKAADTEDS